MLHVLRSTLALAFFAGIAAAQASPVPFCFPNTPGVANCPCSNPPAQIGQAGCAAFGDGGNGNQPTGGASMIFTGQSSISSDNLLLSGVGLNPSTFGMLLESRNTNPAGVLYGAGVRCLLSPIVRVYGSSGLRGTGGGAASWGPGAGDPPIHTAIGAVVGDVTCFQVYYRDPNAPAHCSNPNSTFNVSSGMIVTWAP
jgi:hypothetical protein